MNVPFILHDDALDKPFLSEAKAAGLLARILQSAPRSSAADDVEALRREWHK